MAETWLAETWAKQGPGLIQPSDPLMSAADLTRSFSLDAQASAYGPPAELPLTLWATTGGAVAQTRSELPQTASNSQRLGL